MFYLHLVESIIMHHDQLIAQRPTPRIKYGAGSISPPSYRVRDKLSSERGNNNERKGECPSSFDYTQDKLLEFLPGHIRITADRSDNIQNQENLKISPIKKLKTIPAVIRPYTTYARHSIITFIKVYYITHRNARKKQTYPTTPNR
jgi:hypothetical protein